MKKIPSEQEYGFTPQAKGAACGTCKRFSYRLNTCTRMGEQRAPINIACDKYEERPEGYQHPADVISVDDTATEAAPVATQKCNRCGKELPLTDFARLRGETRRKTCRKCMGELVLTGRSKKAAKKPQRKKKDYEAPATEELPSTVGAVPRPEPPVVMPDVDLDTAAAQDDIVPEGWPVHPFRGGRPVSEWSTADLIEELRSRGFTGYVERREEYAL